MVKDINNPSDRIDIRIAMRKVTGTYKNRSAVIGETSVIPEGEVVVSIAEGFRFQAANSGASDYHLIQASGGKLYVLPADDGSYNVRAFGATGDGVTDDTAAIEKAIYVAESASTKLVFPRGTYLYNNPLSISGIDVDFCGSNLNFTGDPGSFALTLNSRTAGGLTHPNGNMFQNLILQQSDFTEFVTCSASETVDPPSLAGYASVTQITPTITTSVITVSGARAGGFVTVAFDSLASGCEVCGAVTADDEVTLYWSNYTSATVDMPSGTVDVVVRNNAYHGLCIGGGMGILSNFKVTGFTGVSMAVGSGICQKTGVTFPATNQAYYWRIEGSISAAAGYGLVVRPRSNENEFRLSLFGYNGYGDTVPLRHPYISMVIISGITNTFRKLALEASASGPPLVLTNAALNTVTMSPLYFEEHPSMDDTQDPIVVADYLSAGNEITVRAVGRTAKALSDNGTSNRIEIVTGQIVNAGIIPIVSSVNNIVSNGNFTSGTSGWTLYDSSGGASISASGSGYFSGQVARIDVTDDNATLSQIISFPEGYIGRTVTCGAWVRTNLSETVRLNFNSAQSYNCPDDEGWHFLSAPKRVSSASEPLQIKMNTTDTGYFEICNVTAVLGSRPIAF